MGRERAERGAMGRQGANMDSPPNAGGKCTGWEGWFSFQQVHKFEKAKFNTMWGKLSLYFIGPADGVAAGSEADLRGTIFLNIYSEQKVLINYGVKGMKPNIGDVINFGELETCNLLDENDTARLRSTYGVPCVRCLR